MENIDVKRENFDDISNKRKEVKYKDICRYFKDKCYAVGCEHCIKKNEATQKRRRKRDGV